MKPTEILGLFHFVQEHDDPQGALQCALRQKANAVGDISGSLIVLPEGFNLGRRYWEPDTQRPTFGAGETQTWLQAIAGQYGIAFAAGLLTPMGRALLCLKRPAVPYYNSAILIEADGKPRLMWRKTQRDCSQHYEPCGANFRQPDPIECGRCVVTALICLDMGPQHQEADSTTSFRNEQLRRLKQSAMTKKVVCVPSCWTETSLNIEHASYMDGRQYVFANCCTHGCASFITDSAHHKVVEPPDPTKNTILLETDNAELCFHAQSPSDR